MCSKAYNSSLEAAIGTSRGSFQILRLSAFILAQEVQYYVKASPRKLPLKLATLTQNLTLLYHRYSLFIYIYNWRFPCVIPEDFCNAEGRSTREGALSLVIQYNSNTNQNTKTRQSRVSSFWENSSVFDNHFGYIIATKIKYVLC